MRKSSAYNKDKGIGIDEVYFEMKDLHKMPLELDENDAATSVCSDFTVKKPKQRKFLEVN